MQDTAHGTAQHSNRSEHMATVAANDRQLLSQQAWHHIQAVLAVLSLPNACLFSAWQSLLTTDTSSLVCCWCGSQARCPLAAVAPVGFPTLCLP
jgi:hypothetical protein